MLAASDAPGLLEVYEANGETQKICGNPDLALVFVHIGQQAAGDLAAEHLHDPIG